jgi:hypothetical protein
LFGDLGGFFAAELLGHGWIVGGRTDAYYEGLIADAAYYPFDFFSLVGVDGADARFVAHTAERFAFGQALRGVARELFADVGHQVDGDAQAAGDRALVIGVITEAFVLFVYRDG